MSKQLAFVVTGHKFHENSETFIGMEFFVYISCSLRCSYVQFGCLWYLFPV